MPAKIPYFQVKLENPKAVMPSKTHDNDVGYDLTLIEVAKQISPMITMYDTGIAIAAEQKMFDSSISDFYVEVVPRSSLSKTGYILANSIGIIDPDYRGTIKVVLAKIDPSMPDIQLPFKGVQMIVRLLQPSIMVQTTKSLPETDRGNGGFGSTDDVVRFTSPAAAAVPIEPITPQLAVVTGTSRRQKQQANAVATMLIN